MNHIHTIYIISAWIPDGHFISLRVELQSDHPSQTIFSLFYFPHHRRPVLKLLSLLMRSRTLKHSGFWELALEQKPFLNACKSAFGSFGFEYVFMFVWISLFNRCIKKPIQWKKGRTRSFFVFFTSFIIYFSFFFALSHISFSPDQGLCSTQPCFNCLWSSRTANIMITRGNRDYFPCFPCTASRLTRSILMKENGRTAPPKLTSCTTWHLHRGGCLKGAVRNLTNRWRRRYLFLLHLCFVLFYFPSSVRQRGVCGVVQILCTKPG